MMRDEACDCLLGSYSLRSSFVPHMHVQDEKVLKYGESEAKRSCNFGRKERTAPTSGRFLG